MPLHLTSFSVQTQWEGCTWSVTSIDELAHVIAVIAVGQALHVETILHNAGVAPKPTTQNAVKGAIRLLTASSTPYHRDGWLFQIMSWIAAQMRTPGALMNTPHLIHAHKGLDGLEISRDQDGDVTAVVLFEDKATETPRDVITQEVWPGFKEYEAGHNEHVIASEVAQLLRRSGHPDPEQAVAEILWQQNRRYRLSITDTTSTDTSQAKLFKGYEKTVQGGTERRRAEVFAVADLRQWMDDLANLAIQKANALATIN